MPVERQSLLLQGCTQFIPRSIVIIELGTGDLLGEGIDPAVGVPQVIVLGDLLIVVLEVVGGEVALVIIFHYQCVERQAWLQLRVLVRNADLQAQQGEGHLRQVEDPDQFYGVILDGTEDHPAQPHTLSSDQGILDGQDGILDGLLEDVGSVQTAIVLARGLADLLVAVEVDQEDQQFTVLTDVGLLAQLANCGPLFLIGNVQDTELLHEHTGGGVASGLAQGGQLLLAECLRLKGPDRAVVKLMINC